MKRFVRRWWVEHDTPEFGHSIIAGTMHRMHKVAKRDGMPICDYYTVGWIYVYIVKLWVVLWIKEKLLYNPKKGLRFFDQPLTLDFLTNSKKFIFTIVEHVFKNSVLVEENILRGLVFFLFSKIYSKLDVPIGETTSWFTSFFLGHLLFKGFVTKLYKTLKNHGSFFRGATTFQVIP